MNQGLKSVSHTRSIKPTAASYNSQQLRGWQRGVIEPRRRQLYARTNLPPTLTSATYNDANRLTQRGAATLTYDEAGNLTSDGANTYRWNARNQLASISGTVSASFQYDAFGRRISKTINSSTTSYLYDGMDAVQEQASGIVVANMLVGRVDEVFRRTDSAGEHHLLSDGLGSTLALTDAAGAVQTQYTYDAFGNTTTSGAANSNSSQYTGRENDGTGLYFNRTRYYSPTLQRFISEDPIGIAGGINLYAYVENDPINSTDPNGLQPLFTTTGIEVFEGWTKPILRIAGVLPMLPPRTSGRKDWRHGEPGLETDWGAQFMMAAPFAGLINLGGAGLAETAGSVGARDAAISFTKAGERFVRVGARPVNLTFTFETPGGVQPGTYAFPESAFNEIGCNSIKLKNLGDLPGPPPQYYRVLTPPPGTAIQRGKVPGGRFGGEGGLPEVFFPHGW